MLKKIKSAPRFIVFLLYSTVFITFTCLFIQGRFPDSTIMNFRPQASKEKMQDILQSFRDVKIGNKKDIKGDDPGFMFLYVLATYLEGNDEISSSTEARNYTSTYQVFQVIIHLFFIVIFLFIPISILSFTTKRVLLLFLISPNLMAVFWGFDVYLFPLYATIVSLYCWGNIRHNTLSKFKFILSSVLVVVCEIFRKNSLLVFLPVLALLAFKIDISKKNKSIYLGTFFLSLFLMKLLVSIAFQNPGHTIWHSLHAGLFEIGGCVDKKGESYPFIIYDMDNLKKGELVYCTNKWNDVVEYVVAEQHGIKDYFSKDYEELLKKQTIEIVSGHPSEIVSFVMMRFMNILSFLPLKNHTRLGSVEKINLLNMFESIFFLLVFILWFKKEDDWEKRLMLSAMLMFAMAPPLLVHSGHLIYNMSANFIQWLILTAAWTKFLPSIVKKR